MAYDTITRQFADAPEEADLSGEELPLSTIYDSEGRLVAVGTAIAELLGIGIDELIGQGPPFPWWPEDQYDSLRKLFELAIGEGGREFEGRPLTLYLRTAMGHEAPFRCYFRKLVNGNTVIFASHVEVSPDRELVVQALDLLQQSISQGADEPAAQSTIRARLPRLSKREREVLDMLVAGNRVAEISDAIHISIHTARNHRKAIFGKLGVRSQLELVASLGLPSASGYRHGANR